MARRVPRRNPAPAPTVTAAWNVSVRKRSVWKVSLRTVFVLCTLFLASGVSARDSDDPASFAVVVHSENPVRQLDTFTLGRIYLGKTQLWEGGEQIRPVNLPKSDQIRHDFSERILGRSVAAIEGYWQRQTFRGHDGPPLEMGCCDQLIGWLERTPGSIAYVPADTPLPAGLRAIPVVDDSGRLVVDPPRFVPASQDGYAQQSGDSERRVIQSQGLVVLVEAGVCGFRGDGNWIALANQDPTRPLRVSLQTTQHSGGRAWTNLDPLELPAGSETVLGCTVDDQGGWTEFRLAGVADVSTSGRAADGSTVPVADRVRVVAGARCGRDGEGSMLSLINEHPQRGARVRAQHLDTLHEGSTRQYVRTYVLGAGDSRELGCSRDGATRREVALLEIRQD